MRTSISPRQGQRLLAMSMESNVSDVLPLVQAPTLVLHPTDAPVPAESVREFAARIEGAAYEEFPGNALMIYGLDVDWLAGRIEQFMTGTAPVPPSNRVLASILFTDLVGSTERAAELGDLRWSELLDRHLAAAGALVGERGGESIKSLGDGILALFAGPAQAVRCAEAIIAEAAPLGLEVRAGVHTGEVERSRDDVAGLGVHIAARIMSRAGAGEVLVSRTVRDLVVGSELRFTDRGEHELKGVPEPWALYAAG
jgi:class 3 adenylate cyclase